LQLPEFDAILFANNFSERRAGRFRQLWL